MKTKIFTILLAALLICAVLTVCSGCGDTKLTAKEGEPANGFLWVNDYSEITITGYVGSSNEIVIPEAINGKPVTKIRAGAFKGFEALVSVKIPGSVKIIDGAFENCTSLKNVILSEGIESMDEAFCGCTSLESIVIPKGVTSLYRTFDECTSLESIVIPEGVTSLERTFEYCTALKDVTLPESLESLSATFYRCTSLENIVIPKNVTYFNNSFYDCVALKKVSMPMNAEFNSETFCNCASLEELIIPIGTKFTDYYLELKGCSSLKTLFLPENFDGVLRLRGLTSIEKITMPKQALENTMESYFDFYSNSFYVDDYNITERLTKTVEINGKTYNIVFN